MEWGLGNQIGYSWTPSPKTTITEKTLHEKKGNNLFTRYSQFSSKQLSKFPSFPYKANPELGIRVFPCRHTQRGCNALEN
jgi:hypothetical protein